MGEDDDAARSRAARAEQAQQLIELRAGAAKAESRAAQRLIDEFVTEARRIGLAPQPLRASLLSGHSVRTDKRGWYLRRNHSLAIGEDGGYYVLTVAGGWRERLRGAQLAATPPPLQVGAGGRDGETGELKDFLRRALDGL